MIQDEVLAELQDPIMQVSTQEYCGDFKNAFPFVHRNNRRWGNMLH